MKVKHKTTMSKEYFGWYIKTFVFRHGIATHEITTLKSAFGPVTRLAKLFSYRESESGTTWSSKVIEEIEYDCKRWTNGKCMDLHNKAIKKFKMQEVE